MPRHIDPPKSIDNYGGLKGYLNDDKIAEEHNGLRYKDFLFRIRPRKHPYPKTACAEDFNVSTRTWYSWLRRYDAEQRVIGLEPVVPLERPFPEQ